MLQKEKSNIFVFQYVKLHILSVLYALKAPHTMPSDIDNRTYRMSIHRLCLFGVQTMGFYFYYSCDINI